MFLRYIALFLVAGVTACTTASQTRPTAPQVQLDRDVGRATSAPVDLRQPRSGPVTATPSIIHYTAQDRMMRGICATDALTAGIVEDMNTAYKKHHPEDSDKRPAYIWINEMYTVQAKSKNNVIICHGMFVTSYGDQISAAYEFGGGYVDYKPDPGTPILDASGKEYSRVRLLQPRFYQ